MSAHYHYGTFVVSSSSPEKGNMPPVRSSLLVWEWLVHGVKVYTRPDPFVQPGPLWSLNSNDRNGFVVRYVQPYRPCHAEPV